MSDTSPDLFWDRLYQALVLRCGESAIKSWISSVSVSSYGDSVLRLSVPNRFSKDWIEHRYLSDILAASRSIDPGIFDVELSVIDKCESKKEPVIPITDESDKKTSDEFKNFGIALDPNLTFQSFVVGKTNEFAHAAALRVAESESVVFNPLFLYGGVGLGKTHLMHAIAWHIKQKNPNRNIVYMSAEKFMYYFIKAVRFRDTMEFKESFRTVDVLMIDDIQFICGKESTQEEFFHTFNTLVDNKHQVIISADKSPSDLEGMEDRLKSRLGWGLVADIHPTTYELRLGILQSKTLTLKMSVPNKVLEFLAEKITSNIRELEGALNRVVANADLVGREITVESAKEVLTDLIRSNNRKITVEDIQKKVASYYEIKLSDMSSPRRLKQVALPRQVAMYLSKQLTQMSFPEIGRKFGGRDHTTVLHSVKKIDESMRNDQKLDSDIKYLKDILEN